MLVVLAAVPGFLLGTETGLQIIKGALEKTVPGLKIESLSGSAFSLKPTICSRRPGLAFHGNLSWDLSVAKLLSRRVALHDFEISDASLLVRTQEMASSAFNSAPGTNNSTDRQSANVATENAGCRDCRARGDQKLAG